MAAEAEEEDAALGALEGPPPVPPAAFPRRCAAIIRPSSKDCCCCHDTPAEAEVFAATAVTSGVSRLPLILSGAETADFCSIFSVNCLDFVQILWNLL